MKRKQPQRSFQFKVTNRTKLTLGKRASLEISIQAIVIVVLAMTLLGLGLGFVRNLFENIEGTTGEVTEQVKQQIKQQLITSDQKISFPVTEMKIDKGDSQVITIGLRNKNDLSLNYDMDFKVINDPNGDVTQANENQYDGWFQYKSDGTLNPADVDVREVRLSVPTSNVDQGSYFFSFDVTDTKGTAATGDDTTYASKDVFIVVRG